MDVGYNIMSPEFEKLCDLYKGGSPVYCQQQVPNPFKGNPLFIGQSFYTANTLNRDALARPFPQFNGDFHHYGRNDSWIKYDSLQISYNVRMRNGLLKTTMIGERMRFQFGFEAFNLANHNYFGRDQVNTNPEDANGNFGSIFPSRVSTQNTLPRQIQVRFKFNW